MLGVAAVLQCFQSISRVNPKRGRSYEEPHDHVDRHSVRARHDGSGIDRPRANAGRGHDPCASAERHANPSGGVRRLGPVVPAWKPPRLQPAALLVRPLLIGASPSRRCRGPPLGAASCVTRRRHSHEPTAHAASFAASAGQAIVALRRAATRFGRFVQVTSTTAPSRMVTRRSICAAMSGLWVATMARRGRRRAPNWLSVARRARRCARRDCRSVRRPAACAGRWRPRGRSRRAAARRRKAAPGGAPAAPSGPR